MIAEPVPVPLIKGQQQGWYAVTYQGFDEMGEYRLVFHAEDNETLRGRPIEMRVRTGWPVYLPLVIRPRINQGMRHKFSQMKVDR